MRAVTAPYPGAFCGIGHDKLFVWKASLIKQGKYTTRKSTVISFSKCDLPIVQCGEGFLEIKDWTTRSGNKFTWNIGDQLL